MIWVSTETGSKELVDDGYFRPYDVQVVKEKLDFADLMFYGNGPQGPCSIGIERKTIGFFTTANGEIRYGQDLVSSLQSKRLDGHQVPGLFRDYDYVVLLVEGVWRPSSEGGVEVPRNKTWMQLRSARQFLRYRELSNYLWRFQIRYGGYVIRTGGPHESAEFVVGAYKWFQKPWDEHKGEDTIYNGYDPQRAQTRRGGFTRREPSPAEWWASCLPGVDSRAVKFAERFGSAKGLANATEKELEEVEGIGKKRAKQILEWMTRDVRART